MEKDSLSQYYDFVVIGCGSAGIGAALELNKSSKSFVILQARDRIGGRISDCEFEGVKIDLGASWVHCYTKTNPVNKLMKEMGWKLRKFDKRTEDQYVSQIKQSPFTSKEISECKGYKSVFYNQVNSAAKQSAQDLSIWDAGKHYYNEKISCLPKAKKSLVDLLINYQVEHELAASLEELSAKYCQQFLDYGQDVLPEKSYFELLKAIIKFKGFENRIQFNTQVQEILYVGDSNQNCRVLCSLGKVFQCKKVICSLPLGVLKAESVKFNPPFSQKKKDIIQRLGFGLMNKILVSFQKPFWNGNPQFIFVACEERGRYPLIYNYSTGDRYILCVFVTADFAKKISKNSDQETVDDLMRTLSRTFNCQKIAPKSYKITRWESQKFSLGSYTHFDVGSSMSDAYQLRKNINGKLWLVGEHCYAEGMACAYGAHITGEQAAREALSLFTMKGSK